MSKRALAMLIAAVVAVGGGAAALAASVSGDDHPATTMPTMEHEMGGGEMMQGER